MNIFRAITHRIKPKRQRSGFSLRVALVFAICLSSVSANAHFHAENDASGVYDVIDCGFCHASHLDDPSVAPSVLVIPVATHQRSRCSATSTLSLNPHYYLPQSRAPPF